MRRNKNLYGIFNWYSLLLSEEKDLATALKACKRRVALHSEDELRLKERFIKIDKTKGVNSMKFGEIKSQHYYLQREF